MEIQFNNHTIGMKHPTYFIADIAANHDGDLERAKLLIRLAKEAGADAAKFQNFDAPKIVSDYGFKAMSGGQVSHQASWKKSVFEVYKGASIPFEWSMTLVEELYSPAQRLQPLLPSPRLQPTLTRQQPLQL